MMPREIRTKKDAEVLLYHLKQGSATLINEINRLEALLDQNNTLQKALERKYGLGPQPPLFEEE